MHFQRSICVAAFAFAACGGGSKKVAEPGGSGEAKSAPVAPACTDEGAGHDVASAMALAPGAFNGCTATDPDVYSILAPDFAAGTMFELVVKGTGGNATATVYDSAEKELGTATIAKGQEEKLYVVLATNSKMYLKVVGSGSEVEPYAITTKASPLVDEDEPNDTAEEARPLNLDRARTALLQSAANNPNGSADFYRMLVARDGSLRVVVEPGTDEITVAVSVADRKGTRIAEATAPNAGATVTLDTRIKRGEFVIKVSEKDEAPTRPFSAGTAKRYLKDGYRITATVK